MRATGIWGGRTPWRFGVISLSTTVLLSCASNQPAYTQTQPAACNYIQVRTLPIEFSGIRPTIGGSINGHAATMLIDTGSDQTVLLRSAVEKFGLRVGARSGTSTGTNGVSDAYDVRLREFKIGSDDVDSSDLVVVWHALGNLPYDALVGASFLFEQDLELDLSRQYIGFFRAQPNFLRSFPCDSVFLAYWDAGAFVADLTTMSKDDLRPVVEVEVNGKRIRAMIDTGATVSTISPAAAAHVGVISKSQDVQDAVYFDGIGHNRRKSWLARFDTFSLGGETVRHVQLYVKDVLWTGNVEENRQSRSFFDPDLPEMILGIDFLKAHRVLFAISQKRLYFSYLGGSVLNGTLQWKVRSDAVGKQTAAGWTAQPEEGCAPKTEGAPARC